MPESQGGDSHSQLEFITGILDRILQSSNNVAKDRIDIPEVPENADDDTKRLALRKVLEELSSLKRDEYLSDSDLDCLVSFFMDLYRGKPKYRHSYADICDVVFGFADSEDELDEGVPYQVNNLADNINRVYSRMEPSTSQAESVRKLCDHVDLERTRLRHFVDQRNTIREYDEKRKELEEKSSAREAEAKKERDESAKRAREDRKNLEREFANRVDAMRMEFIAILGVFAAIVLAFNGAIGFSASSIQALGTASGVRALVLIAALIGFVLINAIAILMIFLWKMAFNTRVIIGTWPRNCLIVAEVVLVLTMIVCAALSHPAIRTLLGLPA